MRGGGGQNRQKQARLYTTQLPLPRVDHLAHAERDQRRLSRAALRLDARVPPAEDRHDGALLHGRGPLVAVGVEAAQEVLLQAHVLEGAVDGGVVAAAAGGGVLGVAASAAAASAAAATAAAAASARVFSCFVGRRVVRLRKGPAGRTCRRQHHVTAATVGLTACS